MRTLALSLSLGCKFTFTISMLVGDSCNSSQRHLLCSCWFCYSCKIFMRRSSFVWLKDHLQKYSMYVCGFQLTLWLDVLDWDICILFSLRSFCDCAVTLYCRSSLSSSGWGHRPEVPSSYANLPTHQSVGSVSPYVGSYDSRRSSPTKITDAQVPKRTRSPPILPANEVFQGNIHLAQNNSKR